MSADTTAASRAAAEKTGCRFYICGECQANCEHGNVRYTANGQCVQCERAKYRARSAKERAKHTEGGYGFVAFTLGSVANIEKWLASMAHKQGLV